MKLYVTRLGRWAGTQVDARIAAKDDGGQYRTVEVPTDKAGLLDFLNEHAVGAEATALLETPTPSDDDISDLLGDDEPVSAKVITTPAKIDTNGVIDWVLDTATPTQVEVVFGALGARFHEANKGKNND